MAELIADGQTTFLGGQDASKNPDQVPGDSYFAGINVTTKNGNLGPRNGFDLLDITIPDGGIKLPTLQTRTYKDIFNSGKFQAMASYTIGSNGYLVIIISGVIFLVNRDTLIAQILTITDGSKLDESRDRINCESAGRFFVIHDYPAYPVIIDGIEAKRADPLKFQVPISTIGTYNQNRLFIANAGNEFTGGDPTGSLLTPDAPITFEEIETVNAPYVAQIFQLPTTSNNDKISAMTFLAVTDTSTGIGPLLVATQKAIYSYNTQAPRANWDGGPFGSMFVYDAGIVGPRAHVNVNSDLFFLSLDGQLRTAAMSRTEQGKWSRVPISREVKDWLKYWDKSLIKYSFLGYFNNKILVSANPYRVKAFDTLGNTVTDYVFGGLVVLELDNISTLGKDSTPSWAGLWTGVRPMDICTVDDRCFIMSKDTSYINRLWEMNPETTWDTANQVSRNVRSTIYTRAYPFQWQSANASGGVSASSDEFKNKEIHSIDVALNNVQGKFKLDLQFKPSHGYKYVPWTTFLHTAPVDICEVPTAENINGLVGHQFFALNLGAPNGLNFCDPVSQFAYKMFRRLQLKFTLEGKYWELREYKIKAIALEQNETKPVCTPFPAVELPKECDNDWEIPEFNICQP